MLFKEWLLLNENVEQNFDNWVETLIKYAKNDKEKHAGHQFKYYGYNSPNSEQRKNIISVLQEKNLQNFNWFSFCIGYWNNKYNFRKEDISFAIDVTRKMIDSGEITKQEIGSKGWMEIGFEAKDNVAKYLEKQNQLSNREIEKRKKRGEADLDEELVKLIVQENNLKIYYLPKLKAKYSQRWSGYEDEVEEEFAYYLQSIVDKRHQILCKLGKGTKWCTAQPSWDAHEDYVGDDIYIIHKKNKPIYQFVSCVNSNPDNRQFMDINDDSVNSLITPILNLLNKHLKKEKVCYNIKEFLPSVEDLEKLSNLVNTDFISLNRLISNNIENESNLIRIFEKLLEIIDNGQRSNMSVNHIIHAFEMNLKSIYSSMFDFPYNRFSKEIEKRKKLERENMI